MDHFEIRLIQIANRLSYGQTRNQIHNELIKYFDSEDQFFFAFIAATILLRKPKQNSYRPRSISGVIENAI